MTLIQKPGLYTAVQFNGSNAEEVAALANQSFGLDGTEWAVEEGQFVYRAGGFTTKRVPVDHYWIRGPYWGTTPSGPYEILGPDEVADRFSGSV